MKRDCVAVIPTNHMVKDVKYKMFCIFDVGLLDYDKNHNHDYFGQYCNHDYFGQYCNHDYLTRLIAGCITNFFFNANLMYSVNSLL